MGLFGQRKDSDSTGQSLGLGGNLQNQITSMRQQGYADNQIIPFLQSQGHTMDEIQSALGSFNPGVAGGPIDNVAPPVPDANPAFSQPPPMSMPPPMEAPNQSFGGINSENIEEIAESIIDEKWNDLVKDINKVIEWKEKMESRFTKVEQKVEDLDAKFESLHQGVLGKISDYDKNLSNVGVEIKAMEKVFQNILPNLTENVNKLDRLTKNAAVKKK